MSSLSADMMTMIKKYADGVPSNSWFGHKLLKVVTVINDCKGFQPRLCIFHLAATLQWRNCKMLDRKGLGFRPLIFMSVLHIGNVMYTSHYEHVPNEILAGPFSYLSIVF